MKTEQEIRERISELNKEKDSIKEQLKWQFLDDSDLRLQLVERIGKIKALKWVLGEK